jgi:hypothetical protein
MDEDLVARIESWRKQHPGGFKAPEEFQEIEGVVEKTEVQGQTEEKKNLFKSLAERLSTQSNYYALRMRLRQGDRPYEAWALLEINHSTRRIDQGKYEIKLLYLEELRV